MMGSGPAKSTPPRELKLKCTPRGQHSFPDCEWQCAGLRSWLPSFSNCSDCAGMPLSCWRATPEGPPAMGPFPTTQSLNVQFPMQVCHSHGENSRV